MDTSKLRKFATFARTSLIEQVGTRLKTVLAEKSLARRESPNAVKDLELKIKELGEKRVVETVAYTWFNRFCALRYMDVNRYTRIGVLSPAEGQFQPEILAEAKMGHIDEELVPEATRKQVMRLLDGSDKSPDPQGEAYRLLFVAVCNYYHSLMPFMFEKIADYTELLLPDDLLSGTSIPAYTREALLPINCSPEHTEESVEVIGWLYQFYISEEKDSVMARKAAVPTDDLPAVTQLFTPHWIVRYLVESSLGRLWMLNHPDSKLCERMPYYIGGETELDILRVSRPEDIRILDPACGSGHMLTYAYDLLYAIYDEQGYPPTEIPGLILKNNLVGLEICDRAAALAAFALCMKARASDSRFFRRVVQPNIIALQNIRIESEELEDYVDALELDEIFNAQVRKLLHQFDEAKNLGSLIQPTLSESEIDSVRVFIENQKTKIEKSSNELFLRETHLSVLSVLEQAKRLTQRYHVLVANPPYMGSGNFNTSLRAGLENNFKVTRTDLYAIFLERSFSFVVKGGAVAMVTMQSWMFTTSYRDLRDALLKNFSLASMAHLGTRAFGSISGEVVSTTAFVFINEAPTPTTTGTYLRLVNGGEEDKHRALRQRCNLYRFEQRLFAGVPASPIIYWKGTQLVDLFQRLPSVGDIAPFREGIHTGNNELYLRFWWEPTWRRVILSANDYDAIDDSGARWVPYNKGGDFTRWYGNNCVVIAFDRIARDEMEQIKGHVRPSQSLYFKAGGTWADIGSRGLGMKFYPDGYLFDGAGPVVVGGPDNLLLIGGVNSCAFGYLCELLMPNIHYKCGTVKRVPFPPQVDRARAVALSENAINSARADWDNSETSWDFRNQPLLRPGLMGTTLEMSWRNWEMQCSNAISRMQELETENNRLYIAAYGLDGELQPEVPEEQITLARADVKRDVSSFLSYAVGCMMGRYSPDHPGLILANAGDTLREFVEKVGKPLAELTFVPDEDGIIPVLDGEWFDDDIVARARDFLRATFGEATLAENLRFIEASLGKDLRKYFLNDFYKDHLQTYKKRPIYWLFSSPKGTFNALIYMHRYRPDTVGRVLQYLRDFRDKLAHHEEHLQMTAGSANASKAEKTKAVKEVANIKKQIKELEEYEKTLFEVAARKIEIDLDNGVKHNYPLFGSVLRKIPGLDAKDD